MSPILPLVDHEQVTVALALPSLRGDRVQQTRATLDRGPASGGTVLEVDKTIGVEASLRWNVVSFGDYPPHWETWKRLGKNLLARALETEWSVTAKLSDLPSAPEISINGTTAETGKRFRFKRDTMGDYLLGYADPGSFPLASALAVSAAFPGGFGPLALDPRQFSWTKRAHWNAPEHETVQVSIGHQRLHLYDGGVYDNLGLEPFFDAGRVKPKISELIVVSDAGAPLLAGFSSGALNPWRLKRVADIMSDQSRALRVRSFAHFLEREPTAGAYLYIAMPLNDATYHEDGVAASAYPTTLVKPSPMQFDRVAEHGYRVAQETAFMRHIIEKQCTSRSVSGA